MPPVAEVLPLERTDELLLLVETLEELRELLLPEERTEEPLSEELRVPELTELRELLLLLLEEERTAELLLERVEELLVPEDRVLLLLFLLRSCCTAEELLPLERVLPLLLEERTEELLPEDRVLEEPVDREEEEPEPVDRLLEEELVDRLPLVERVWATIFSEASRERTSIREVAMLTNFLIASQF